ncbi:hypothetical protein HERIO_2790 [Hepatospora eriocheir]|uniref:Uncharacterized protein n=1 Tax=Hepatospora eriocheir TaxID=1081669 RepID=A0A1X0Q6J4_9MICR|nr:hypothetical protein HERIO_2790 [Hepatospora eriocheir]
MNHLVLICLWVQLIAVLDNFIVPLSKFPLFLSEEIVKGQLSKGLDMLAGSENLKNFMNIKTLCSWIKFVLQFQQEQKEDVRL